MGLYQFTRSADEIGVTEIRCSEICDVMRAKTSPVFEIARVLVRFNYVARRLRSLHGAAFRPLILRDERFGLLTCTATTETVLLCVLTTIC